MFMLSHEKQPMADRKKIQKAANDIIAEVVSYRRHLHAHPELSFNEYETADYLASILDSWDIPFERVANTGLVAHIRGENPDKKVIALRADTDALPITEANDQPYASQNEGVMHACGHDVHTASMLGVVRLLNAFKKEFEGTIKILFQPGEEKAPGGASLMIKEGALEEPVPEVIFGQHVLPELESGTVGFKPGKFMASSDEIRITVQGQGGHAAMPYKLVDPVLIASHVVVGLQQLVSRNADPNTPSVLSFGVIEGKGANNVIPDSVYLEGTFRTFEENWRQQAHEKIRSLAKGIAQSMGGDCDVVIDSGYPTLYNNETLTAKARQYATDYLGEDSVIDLPLRMTAEDFAIYSQYMPAAFYRLGVANQAKGIDSALHTPTFDIDEASLKTGVGLMTFIALRELENRAFNG